MKYCSNCGSEIDEKAVICVKCGVPVNNNMNTVQNYNQAPAEPKQGHGAATASLILGILGLIAGIITLLITLGIFFYYKENVSSYYSYTTVDTTRKLILCLLLSAVPGILSLIGFPLGCFCKKGGPKIAGIILNVLTLVICVIQVILIMSL